MARRYTEDDVAQWYARYQDGLTLKEVTRELKVSESTVIGAFLRRRLPRRPAVRRSALGLGTAGPSQPGREAGADPSS